MGWTLQPGACRTWGGGRGCVHHILGGGRTPHLAVVVASRCLVSLLLCKGAEVGCLGIDSQNLRVS